MRPRQRDHVRLRWLGWLEEDPPRDVKAVLLVRRALVRAFASDEISIPDLLCPVRASALESRRSLEAGVPCFAQTDGDAAEDIDTIKPLRADVAHQLVTDRLERRVECLFLRISRTVLVSSCSTTTSFLSAFTGLFRALKMPEEAASALGVTQYFECQQASS